MAFAVHHRTATVNNLEVFYREAGDPTAPVVVLLHGFPTSSHMFRHLIPELADRYHVIAPPDHIGFGQSSMPTLQDFPYTFGALTDVTSGLLQQLGVDRFALYVQDYGAPPIGWRLALQAPDRITAIVTQNGNATKRASSSPSGTACSPTPRPPRTGDRSPHAGRPDPGDHPLAVCERRRRPPAWSAPTTGSTTRRCWTGPETTRSSSSCSATIPPTWTSTRWSTSTSATPRFRCWRSGGANDEIFGPPAGAEAFRQDLPDAEIHLLESGHFALESHLETITERIRDFLARALA